MLQQRIEVRRHDQSIVAVNVAAGVSDSELNNLLTEILNNMRWRSMQGVEIHVRQPEIQAKEV